MDIFIFALKLIVVRCTTKTKIFLCMEFLSCELSHNIDVSKNEFYCPANL